jgi:hypothetical protein
MAGRRTVILEEFSYFQLDFSPLPGEPQIACDGLLEKLRRIKQKHDGLLGDIRSIKLKSCRAGQRLNLDLEQAGQDDSE